MKKCIPNAITCLNLFSGCVACVMAFHSNYLWAFIFIAVAAIFDFFDGFAARLLKAYSPIGKELDSLADVISFGMAPGIIIFSYLLEIIPFGGIFFQSFVLSPYIPYLAFLITVFSALRLAKFNVDERQTSSFIGLPVPADALFWSALVFELSQRNEYPAFKIIGLITLVVIFSYLMISEIPMFSLKFKNYGWKGNEPKYVLIISAIVLFCLFGIFGISITIGIYILLSLFIKEKSEQ